MTCEKQPIYYGTEYSKQQRHVSWHWRFLHMLSGLDPFPPAVKLVDLLLDSCGERTRGEIEVPVGLAVVEAFVLV